ncbi:MAG: Lrp/AsnC family transcriptional regulator [Candidatus Diapherotrites archaeon]|nr:Lrp/AsnC family transcriptional regulator [Candidatus Diapherotrites archaeon]
MSTEEIDALDKLILDQLAENSRQSFRTLAKKLGVAITTVINRVEVLKEKGIIKRYSIEIDYEKLGYGLSAIIEIEGTRGETMSLEEKLSKHKNVSAVYDVTGQVDSLIIAKFKSNEELNEFIRTVLGMDEISKTTTHLVLKTVKEKSCWLP